MLPTVSCPQPPQPEATTPDPCNLIVNYIPTPVTDEKLRELFAPFGTVVSARVIVDRFNNHPKGYGFVKYTTKEAAKNAIRSMNGYKIGNKHLRVTQANGPQNHFRPNPAYTEPAQAVPAQQVFHFVTPAGAQTPYTVLGADPQPQLLYHPGAQAGQPMYQTVFFSNLPQQQMSYVAAPQGQQLVYEMVNGQAKPIMLQAGTALPLQTASPNGAGSDSLFPPFPRGAQAVAGYQVTGCTASTGSNATSSQALTLSNVTAATTSGTVPMEMQ